jgi:hypothetical protein
MMLPIGEDFGLLLDAAQKGRLHRMNCDQHFLLAPDLVTEKSI